MTTDGRWAASLVSGSSMDRVWRYRRTDMVVPLSLAMTMWRRARMTEGVYADRSSIQLLSDDEYAEAVGVIRLAWQRPSPQLVTIWKIEWDPDLSSETEVWNLIDDLAPAPLEHRAA